MQHRRGIRSPRKVVIRAGIFLLLGAIVNIAVAWGISFRPNLAMGEVIRGAWPLPDGAWYVSRWGGFGEQWVNFSRVWDSAHISYSRPHIYSPSVLDVIPEWTHLADPEVAFQPGSEPLDYRYADALGWPLLTLRCELDETTRVELLNSCVRGGLLWSAKGERWGAGIVPRVLPFVPIWPGFAINTLFYAAILWLLFALLGALRRWRRIKRGLCPACAYPVGTSDLCTECGKPVTAA